MGEVRLHLLGRFRVLRDGQEVPPAAFAGRKVRVLLRILATRRPDLVANDVLAAALWPDRLPADPAGNVNVLVNRARRALGDPALVITGPGGYALGQCRLDIAEFLDAVTAARDHAAAGDPGAALRSATAALALWAEPLPEDAYTDWARGARERLTRAWVDVLEAAAGAASALGDHVAAAGYAADVVAAEPLRESGVLLLARALAARGDRAGALTQLDRSRRRLAEELGVDPSAEAADLQLRLLRGDAPAAAAGPGAGGGSPVPSAGGAVPSASGAVPSRLRFVGRDDAVARLRRVLAEGGIAAVGGVAGVGKSRLVAEALRGWTAPVIAAKAFSPERAEAWGLARSLLREALAVDDAVARSLPPRIREVLSTLLPELAELSTSDIGADGESRRALLLAGGLRILEAATGDGAVLVADDVQWADPSSLTLLGSALARLPRLAAVLVFRSGELPASVLAELRDVRPVTDITLDPLTPAAVAGLVGDRTLAAAVVDSTDRTPFAIAEVLRELVALGAVRVDATGWCATDPSAARLAAQLGRAGQRRSVLRRIERHAAGTEVLALVALLAREAPARTVAEAAELPHRAVLDTLSALAEVGLVRLGEDGWAAAHDLVGETVVAHLTPARLGRLHGLLARALEAEDADPSEVARHHRESGDSATAAAWYERAARAALRGHATHESVALCDAGLALHPRGPARGTLLELRADAGAVHGAHAAAEADLRAALLADPAGPRARRLARLAMLTFGAQNPRRAAELAELALVEATDDAAMRAFALDTAAILDMNLGEPARAAARAQAALELYQRLGDAGGVARILDGRAMATFLDGRIGAAVELFDRVARSFGDAGDLLRVVTPRSTRGHGLVFLGRPAEGLTDAAEALRLARDLDAAEGQAYALWHRSEALSALGRPDEGLADAAEALRVALDAGHRGWTATAHRARGIALQVRGLLDEAAAAFRDSAVAAGSDLTLFASWAAARGAMCAVALGRLADADRLTAEALATGPALGHYEARLAAVELASARGDAGVTRLAAGALAAAEAGGHAASAARLAELSRNPSGDVRRS
ncbi:ATP-binding protein [Dactylosporangium cerinum]